MRNVNIIPKNLMKNNSFLIENNNPIIININRNQDYYVQKRSKSTEFMKSNFIDFNEELKIIEPKIPEIKYNCISKILSFKNNETKGIIKNDKKIFKYKENTSRNQSKQLNISKKYNTFETKFVIEKKKKLNDNSKKMIKEFSTSRLLKVKSKKNNFKKVKINNNKSKKIISHKKCNTYYNKYSNNSFNSEKINYLRKEKNITYKNSDTSLSKKENKNTINFSKSNKQNSISTDLNSVSDNNYSPNITFGNNKTPNLNKIKCKKIPQEFVYIKKNNKIKTITSKGNKSFLNNNKIFERIVNYNKFQINLNNIKINGLYDSNNNYINYNVDENDNINEEIKNNKRFSYIGKFKTFEQIEKRNENLNIIRKIINNNLKLQTSHYHEERNNDIKSYSLNDQENYNYLKTGTFCEIEK